MARTLFAQVAEKCLACELPIPWCVLKPLQEDNHWHRLLRVYIEFGCLDKAVELAGAKLETHKTAQILTGPRRDIPIALRAGLRVGGGVGMGVPAMVFVGLVLGCIEAKFCK